MKRGAFAVIIKHDEVLLVKSLTSPLSAGLWSLPGGLVEDDETVQSGAKREAIEETGIVCEIGELLSTIDNPGSNIVASIFKAEYISGEIVKDDIEIAEAKWFNLSEAVDLPLAYNTETILRAL